MSWENFLRYRGGRWKVDDKMKLDSFIGGIDRRIPRIYSVSIVVFILLVGSISLSTSTIFGDDNGDDEVEVPKWYEEDTWTYSDKIPMPEVGHVETVVDLEVIDEDGKVRIGREDGEDVYDSYVVRATPSDEGEEEEEFEEIEFRHWKENLAEVYHHELGQEEVAYNPPIINFDFPLYEGKEWDNNQIEETVRFYSGLEGEEPADPQRYYWYSGRVEETGVMKEVPAGEFETYMINLTVNGFEFEGQDVEDAILKRYEIYYSPEVKNAVFTEVYETRRIEGAPIDIPDEEDPIHEDSIGNETLIDYDVTHEDTDDDEIPLFNAGFLLLIIVGAGLLYHKKKSKT